ncbi:MAG TPA: hypothetical protein VFL85_00375 [Candidatus Saccharimonadales bacterium]|nr:hypothetical protein [Candidatus Saccharimonadales bacterium]
MTEFMTSPAVPEPLEEENLNYDDRGFTLLNSRANSGQRMVEGYNARFATGDGRLKAAVKRFVGAFFDPEHGFGRPD